MKIKTGIIGLGRSGWDIHCKLLQMTEGFDLYAVSDIDNQRVKEAETAFGAKGFLDYREMLEDSQIALVTICATSDTHSSIAVDTLNAGKNVIVEKPMCLSLEEAERMLTAARANKRILTVFQNKRLDLDFLQIKKILEAGLLGRIFSIFSGIYEYQKRADWQIKKELGGGVLNNWGSHIIDQILQLVSEEPKDVYCQMKRIITDGKAEDYFKSLIHFANGVTAEVEITDCAKIGLPRWYILGDKGSLLAAGHKEINIKTDIKQPDEEIKYIIEETKFEDWAKYYENIYQVLHNENTLLVTPESAVKLIKVLDACRKSSQKGQVCHI